jgi:hypothetical protein
VSFKIGEGKEHVIELQQATVRIWYNGVEVPPRPGIPAKGNKKAIPDFGGLTVSFVYPGTAEPFIACPSDLTEEKLGNLIKLVIEKE